MVMANFKILSIKVLTPKDTFLLEESYESVALNGDPETLERALRKSRYRNIHKVLEPGVEYKFINNSGRLPDDFFKIKSDYKKGENAIDISVSAVVGQNGSGKSTLLELFIRLINNAAYALKNAYVSRPMIPLQFVEDVYAELTYQLPDERICKLRQDGSTMVFEINGNQEWKYDRHENNSINMSDAIFHLGDFFISIVLNYSSYSFNLYNFRPEWSDLPPDDGTIYTDEDRCWLSAIFHKNDAYQTPIVLNPFRSFGEIDFNNEADLTRDRLFLLSIQNVDMLSVLMEGMRTHSIVFDTKMSLVEQPQIPYSSPQLADLFIQFRTISDRTEINKSVYKRCEKLCEMIIDEWEKVLCIDLHAATNNKSLDQDIRRALNYLAYKTIKVTLNYALYSHYRQCFALPRDRNEAELADNYMAAGSMIPQLVKELWEDPTHVALKIHKTLAFLKFKHYYLGMGIEKGLSRHQVSAGRFNKIIEDLYNDLGGDGQDTWKREYLLPAPCFDARLILSEPKYDCKGNAIPGEEVRKEMNSLSSGQMQLLYSLSTVLYHLKNVDSNIVGGRNSLRYPCVNLVFDEIELYFHPNFQKDLLYDLIYAIQKMNYKGIKHINIIIATHSPYILSDFPKSNVLCLENGNVYSDEGHELGNTFSANVYDILNSRFFMNEFVGRFAVKKLDEIIDEVKKGESISKEQYKKRLELIELIGDEFVREKLKEELLDKLGERERREMAVEEIKNIKRRMDYLESIIEEGGVEK